MKTNREKIKLDNGNGVSYLRAAIQGAWNEVILSGKSIELHDIPLSILENVLEDNKVDLSLSFCEGDGTYIEYNYDYIHFLLDKETGTLRIYIEK